MSVKSQTLRFTKVANVQAAPSFQNKNAFFLPRFLMLLFMELPFFYVQVDTSISMLRSLKNLQDSLHLLMLTYTHALSFIITWRVHT